MVLLSDIRELCLNKSMMFEPGTQHLRSPQPYGDISGIGVVISVVGTSYLVLLLLIANYLIIHDPFKNHFQDDPGTHNTNLWRPNSIDTRLLVWVRSLHKKAFPALTLSWSHRLVGLEGAFNETIINMCDIQIATGTGILISGFISLDDKLSAPHWQVIVSLAWFSTVTHWAGLSVIRSHLSKHPWKRNVRCFLILSLFILLLVALLPTANFVLFQGPDGDDYDIPFAGFPAICYWNFQIRDDLLRLAECYVEKTYFNEGEAECHKRRLRDFSWVDNYGSLVQMALSACLLLIGLLARLVKIFSPLANGARKLIRRPLGRVLRRLVINSAPSEGCPDSFLREMKRYFVFWPSLAIYLSLRTHADLFGSMLAEMCWFSLIIIWGTRKLSGARQELPPAVREEENRWLFGQILPVLLLMAPIMGIISMLMEATPHDNALPLDDRNQEPSAAGHELSVSSGQVLTSQAESNTENVQSSVEVGETVKQVCSQFPNSYWQEHDQEEKDPKDFHAALARGGWLGIALPESLGGSGLGISEAVMMMQTITESGAGMAGAQAIHANVYATQPLAKFGTRQQLEETIPNIITGKWRTCFGVTEPDAGLDTLRLTTKAQKVGEEYIITGQKIWTTCAQVASKMILLARTTPRDEAQTPSEGLSLFCIDLDRTKPGLTMRKIKKMGGRAVDANEVFFDGYRVPASSLIGTEGQGFKMILHGMNAERCLLAGEALGLGYAALTRAAAYARERVVFQRPIGMNQGIAHPLADAYVRLEAAKLATYHAARLYDASKTDPSISQKAIGVAANSAKYIAAEAAFTACERAVLTHGGMGYAVEYDVERWFRECLVPRIAPVSREMILNYISEKVLDLPRSY
ncbi:Acyl-CoA dehydrogenase FadE12 [Cladobotryum mycophilum]|uniref:Acyl-CoA dehydrogenase FadE12 n=1 Tax=Cladobotryum mycophilum TaxID=491253 RepID=A0ABR0ST52_9HYPO